MDLVVRRLERPLIVALPHTPVGMCARLLVRHGIRHLPVVDELERPVGIIEDTDVFRMGALFGPNDDVWLAFDAESDRLRAADLLRSMERRCTVGSPTLLALNELASAKCGAVGVLDPDGSLVGLFTEHDGVVAARDLVDPNHRVGDFATFPAETVDWMDPAMGALERMTDAHIRHLVVMREGALAGVVSLRDLRIAADPDRRDWVVYDAMHDGEIHTTRPEESVRDAAARMASHRIGCLPVRGDDEAVLGILTRTDLVRASVQALRAAMGGGPRATENGAHTA